MVIYISIETAGLGDNSPLDNQRLGEEIVDKVQAKYPSADIDFTLVDDVVGRKSVFIPGDDEGELTGDVESIISRVVSHGDWHYAD